MRLAAALILIAGAIIASAVVVPVGAQDARQKAGAASCDRGCLTRIADSYFAALAAHDPSKAPMAPNARFTEQTQLLAVGEGLWKTTTEAPTTFKVYVADPVAGQLGAIVMLKDPVGPAQLALRLKVVNGQITEAEHLIARPMGGSLANLQTPRPGLLATIPANERMPREVLLLFGRAYYDALEQSDGRAVPFADDCVRRENGMQTAGPRAPGAATTPAAPAGGRGPGLPGAAGPAQLCGPQLDTRVMSYIESIDLRRVWIADPERGLVFGLSMFRHPIKEPNITVVNPDGTREQRPVAFKPFDLPAAHIFKIQGNKIHDIEAMGFQMPLYSKNGWSDFVR